MCSAAWASGVGSSPYGSASDGVTSLRSRTRVNRSDVGASVVSRETGSSGSVPSLWRSRGSCGRSRSPGGSSLGGKLSGAPRREQSPPSREHPFPPSPSRHPSRADRHGPPGPRSLWTIRPARSARGPPAPRSPAPAAPPRPPRSPSAAELPFIASSAPSGRHQRHRPAQQPVQRRQGPRGHHIEALAPVQLLGPPADDPHLLRVRARRPPRRGTWCAAAAARPGSPSGRVGRSPGPGPAARRPSPGPRRWRPAAPRTERQAVEHVAIPQPRGLPRPDQPALDTGGGQQLDVPLARAAAGPTRTPSAPRRAWRAFHVKHPSSDASRWAGPPRSDAARRPRTPRSDQPRRQRRAPPCVRTATSAPGGPARRSP